MPHNFDEIINRKNTNSLKYDFGSERKHRDDLLPLWIADMDFRLPDEIIDDLHTAISHGIFGYSEAKDDYFISVHDWFLNHFNWDIKKDWLIKTPGVVYAIALAIKAFSKEGDSILIQQPVYYPFSEVINDNNRKLINSQLIYENGHYRIDFDDFEEKIVNEHVKLFLLCNPQNPTGRVWTSDELIRMGEICLKHHVLVLSDEIHCDFTYPSYTHTVFASINNDFAANSIICTSPSKTFNMAGMQISNIFIADPTLRNQFFHEMDASGYSQLTTLGIVACTSAYSKGEQWLSELKSYLKENLDYVRTFINEKIPEIKLVEPEGTYLIWLDCSELGLSYKELEKLVIDKAKLWLDGGIIFGKETALFERINIACPRSVLETALTNLEQAIHEK